MTAKHTPGPWNLVDTQVIGHVKRRIPTTVASVHFMFHPREGPLPEGQANARLIAAAPDLLEACEKAIHLPALVQDGKLVEASQVLSVIHKAIAKAKGEK